MKKTELLKIIKKLLKPETDLDFLLQLDEKNLEALVACIRERINQLSTKKQ